MSIEQLDEETEWDLSKVLPGEVIEVPAPEGDEDIAPGIIEVIPMRQPVLYQAGSAAMTVAAVTGRALGLAARPAVWAGVGGKHTCILCWRYVRAHDHRDAIGGISSDSDWRTIGKTRRKRWKFLGITTGVTALLDTLGWWAITVYGGIPADTSWMLLPGAEAAAVVLGMAAYGRYRIHNPGIPTGQILHGDDMPDTEDDDEPYPLAWCKDGHQVEDCVRRALAAEGISTRRLKLKASPTWGRELDLDLKGCTRADVSKALDALDTHLDLQQGGTMPEFDPARAAHLTLRLIESDPFVGMLRPQVHAPNSLSVKDLVAHGQGMDGSPFELRLQGLSMLLVGSSGSAKTKGALRSLAEAITACRDAIAIEMDPVKDGLAEFSGAMAVPPIRGGKACIEWLRHLVQIAKARNGVKSRLEMGDLWKPSAAHPTVFVLVDEFIYLPQEAKELAIELLRLGRETGVHLIFAAQEGTQDALGDAIASAVTYRIMLASRTEDIVLVFGKGASADGYRPDRLRPAVDEVRVYDAGKFYIQGPGFLRPIQWRWRRLEREQIRQAVADRQAAGRPWFDRDSLVAADLLHVLTRDGAVGESSLADQLDAHAQQTGIEDARLVAVLLREFERAGVPFLPTSERLLPALEGAGFDQVDGGLLGRKLKQHAPGAAAGREDWEGRTQVRGWHRSTVERVAGGLLDPTKARL